MNNVQQVITKIEKEITGAPLKALKRKATLVACGAKEYDQAVKELVEIHGAKRITTASKQRVWVDSDSAWNLGVTVASSGSETGLGGSWFTRRVTNIHRDEYGNKVGIVTINFQKVVVTESDTNEWNLF